jgi:hypothetical protein
MPGTHEEWVIGEAGVLVKDAFTCYGYEASVIGYMWVQSVGEMKEQIHSAVLQD